MKQKLEQEIHKAVAARKRQWCQKDNAFWFHNESESSEKYLLSAGRVSDMLSGKKPPIIMTLVFKNLSQWHLINSQYQMLCHGDASKQKQHFIQSSWLGYLYLQIINRTGRYGVLSTAGLIMAQGVICGWKEALYLGDNMIQSINLNTDDKIDDRKTPYNSIGAGSPYSPVAWFILDVYCAYSGKNYIAKYADKPKEIFDILFNEIVQRWDTKDLLAVDEMVSKLCDYHFASGQGKSDELRWEQVDLYPYEIYAWMAFRRLAGLKNPDSFSHLLMNQEYTQAPSGSKPFDKPDIDFVKPLFEKYISENPNCLAAQFYGQLAK